MQQAPQVDSRLEVIFLNAQGREICSTGGDDIRVLEQVTTLEMFMREGSCRHFRRWLQVGDLRRCRLGDERQRILAGGFPFTGAFTHHEILARCRQRNRRQSTGRQSGADLLQSVHDLRRGNLRGLERTRDAEHQQILKTVFALAARRRWRDESGLTQFADERWRETEKSLQICQRIFLHLTSWIFWPKRLRPAPAPSWAPCAPLRLCYREHSGSP